MVSPTAALRVRYVVCGSWDPLALLGPVLGASWVCFDDLGGSCRGRTCTYICVDMGRSHGWVENRKDSMNEANERVRSVATNMLEPTAASLAPCFLHVAAAKASLSQLEEQLDVGDDTQTALRQVNEAAAELQDAFAFIDQIEHSVAAAALLVEATERRLEALERGEQLPESLAQLSPAIFDAHQFSRSIARQERGAPPHLPELSLLPPSRAGIADMNNGAARAPASGATNARADELLEGAAGLASQVREAAASQVSHVRERAFTFLSSFGLPTSGRCGSGGGSTSGTSS